MSRGRQNRCIAPKGRKALVPSDFQDLSVTQHGGFRWLRGFAGRAGEMRDARGYGGAAAVGRSLYIVGGGNGAEWYNSVERYDLDAQRWDRVRPC